MISLDSTQLAIVAAANKDDISWLFEIDRTGNDVIDDYWSTKAKTWNAQAYTFKIADFTDIQMVRAQSESGIQAPSSFDFTVSNKDNTLLPSNFSGGNVTLKLVVKAGEDEEIIRTWNFDIEGVEPGQQKLFFHCKDWLQKYLEGYYPKTPLISRLFPEDDTEHDNFCVPLIFGKPCIPIVPILLNYVPNGYMEADANWANYGSPSVNERSDEHIKEGLYSRKFTIPGNGSGNSGIKSDAFTSVNGKTQTIDFWVYPTGIGGNYVWLAVRKGDDSGWLVYDKFFLCILDMWNHFSYSFTEGAATGGAGAYVVFYGTARSDGVSNTRYIDQVFLGESKYLLGAKITNPTDYDVEEIQTPRDWDGDHQIWSKNDYTFKYSHKTGADSNDYTFGEFIVVDKDNNGTPDDNILFKHSKRYLPAAAWYTRSDTISKTNPGDILDYILQDWGIPAARIDATTLAAVKSTYTGWGLTWNLGLWTQEERKKILARLLLMCHTELIVRDKIYFKVHSKTSQKTLTKAHITKENERGEGSFKYDLITSQEINDSAYVAFQEQGKCLDQLLKIIVTAKGSADNTSDDIIRADYVQDSQDAQRIGTLAIQRKYLPLAKVSHATKATCLALECDDVITLNHADYGGSYAILIDSMTINKNLSIDIDATRFSQALDDWGDLSPSIISVVQIPDSDSYKIVISGPDSVDAWGNYIGNVLPGRLRIGQTGNYILLDPVEPIQTFVEGGVTRMKIGDLGTDDWGIEFLDHAGNSIFKLDGSGVNTIAGWGATDKKFTCQSGQVGMNAEETGGVDWRFWAGHATPGSAPFRVDESGNLYCTLIYATGGTIGGWTIGATKLSITGIELDQANNRIRAYTGANYVDMTAAGLTGYDSVLGTTFKLPTNGDAPEFSSGIIKECVYEIYTSGVIRTNANPAADGGLIINNTDIKGYTSAGLKVLQFIYDGTDQGDAYIGDFDNANPGLKYDHSAGLLNYRGIVILEAGSVIEGLDATNVKNWAHASDVTKIDGGTIYTNTIVASAINGAGFGTLTITSGKIVINTADALEIQAAGNIKVLAGSDINLIGSNSDPGLIKFYGTSYNTEMGSDVDGNRFSIVPSTGDLVDLYLGNATSWWGDVDRAFQDIYLNCYDHTLIRANDGAGHHIDLDVQLGGVSYVQFTIQNNDSATQHAYKFKRDILELGDNKTQDLANATNAWDDAYADDWHNVADFFCLDEYDDLQAILDIKPGKIIDKRTGLTLIDDNSLPEWMLSRYKKNGVDKDDKGKIIRKWKKGDIMRDPEGKPYISLKMIFSSFIGTIKRLNQKIEDLA